MADFHSSDGWFIWGIITIVLHLALVSGWHRLRHVLYSGLWPAFSLMEVIAAVLSILLHSKVSNPRLLHASALWSLLGLVVLIASVARSYVRFINVLEPEHERRLRYVMWTQYLTWAAIPFFASSTACWVYSDSGTSKRIEYRNMGRVLNWTGNSILVVSFIASTTAGCVIAYWTIAGNTIPRPVSTASYGALLSVPFVVTRLTVQMYWMRYRNTNGATFGLHVGGSVIMDLMASIFNLAFAWYTFSSVNSNAFRRLYELRTGTKRVETSLSNRWSNDSVATFEKSKRKSSMLSNFSAASLLGQLASWSSLIGKYRSDRAFPTQFSVKSTGRLYRVDNENSLIRSVKRSHKGFQTGSNGALRQPPFSLDPVAVKSDAQRVIGRIAKALWLFIMWEACSADDADQRRAIEVDVLSIWYDDVPTDSGPTAMPVHVMKPFHEIKDAVLGSQQRRPVDKMLRRVYLHFFSKMTGHSIQTQACVCLYALRLMLNKDPGRPQLFEHSFTDADEGGFFDVDESLWRKLDELAVGRAVD